MCRQDISGGRHKHIDTPPTGLVVITHCDPSSQVMASKYEELVEAGRESGEDLEKLKTFLSAIKLETSREVSATALAASLRE